MTSPVTMKTIAAQAGVTQATVSMCLANNPRIPAATRERIHGIAKELGYRPNPYVSALMRVRRQGRTVTEKPVIALVNGLDHPNGWRESAAPTVRLMLKGALERAELRGYRAKEFWLHQNEMSAERFSGMLYARGIHGLVLGPLAVNAALPNLKWEHFAAVRLAVPHTALTITTVCNDHFFSALQVVRECHKLGYRRPGLVILKNHRERFLGRWDGGVYAGSELFPGLKPVPTLLLENWESLEPVEGWLKRHTPDVLITPSGEAVLAHVKKLGCRVPRDLGVATLACSQQNGAVSGIWQNGALIGATAVDTLISMLERHERGLPEQAQTFMIEGVWNAGKTLRAAP
ncbi:LacI family DNA-binding transcriptional regulator [Oleiharenicola lentus]|uniref:LacI family DNA-binding transcriptional regulator n=1 Tax=Oleiharenicola lentus TaxID=2508720 RepID=UPI003F675609